MVNKEYKGFLVSETHWDREWYLSFHEFRKWLVKMMDDLLDNLPTHPEFKSFMMDGQTIVLSDYLEIRPERKEELYNLIRQNRIEIGPFYVLADEFLESGEGMIRNLLLGFKISESVGVQPMKAGYVPDTFGHIWQLPQILQGFGIPSMFYFRGYPPVFGNHEEYEGKNENTPLEHFYQSPDGSKVLTIHQIVGYGNAAGFTDGVDLFLNSDEEEFPYMNAIFRIGETFARAVPRIKSNNILFMNGTDHRQAEWLIPDLIKKWNVNEDLLEEFPVKFEHGTLSNYFNAIQSEIDNGLELPTITGEARGSAYTQVTPGCISTRMNLKLLNWICQTELERYAEPFSAMSWIFGAKYQESYIELAWKWLIKNHPHDSICGCSLDRVHDDMITRFNWALDNASDVANYSCASILSGIDVESIKAQICDKFGKSKKSANIQILGVFNPHAYSIPFIVDDYITLTLNHTYKLYDYMGEEVSNYNIEYIPDYRKDIENGQYLYKRFQKTWSLGKVTALLPNIPAYGYKIYVLVGENQTIPELIPEKWCPEPIQGKEIEVTFNSNGSININDKRTNHAYESLNLFEDGADDGDEYDWAPLKGDKILYTSNKSASYCKLDDNSVFTKIEALLDFQIPFELLGDADTNRVRSGEKVILKIKTIYTIYKGLNRVDVKTFVENKAKGHRLRAIFPAKFDTNHSFADDHFMVMKRTIDLPKDDGWYQDMQGIYHQDTFVDISDGSKGLAIFNHGLCEFEAITTPVEFNQSGNAIALTLYRSVAWLSQNGHLGRKSGLNGPNLQTPGAQLMDHRFEFEYSIFPHEGDWESSDVYQSAFAYNAPPRWFSTNHNLRNEKISNILPNEKSLICISNPKVILSTIKKSARIMGAKDGLIIRVFNPTASTQSADVSIGFHVKSAFETNLLEQEIKPVEIFKTETIQKLKINVGSNKIQTYLIEFA